ncbi:MAG: DNA-processing protein DprA [Bdellovibrionales bacterium]|jgi:DNA processing protein|nr:DNA-processing protein DprA [Bdellovibrionales bacterium]
MSAHRTISRFCPEYPDVLLDLEDPPPFLSVAGCLPSFERPVLAIVGTRASSVLGESWIKQHLPRLARQATIVSGGARGIDEWAHRVTLAEKQATVVVLPSALDRPYPPGWLKKEAEVLACGGGLVSEYGPGTEVRRWHFEKRNRLIAALADVVVVVEARRRSGSAITARHAREIGRAVASVPWFPGDPRGEFCNELLFQGAHIVRGAEDVETLLRQESLARFTRVLRGLAIPGATKQEAASDGENNVR